MKITFQSTSNIRNKHLRLIKWRLYRLGRRFDRLIYADVFIKEEKSSTSLFVMQIRFGIKGNDLILKTSGNNVEAMVKELYQNAHRYLNKSKEKFSAQK